MRRWRLSILLLALVAAGAQTRRIPNLSGTWELVLEKSDFGTLPPPKSVVNVIEHKEPFLTVKSTMVVDKGTFSSTLKYRSTGAQDENDSHGTTMTSWSKWFGDEFVIEGEVVAGKQFVRFRERWSLADGGKTLVNNRLMYLRRGEMPQKLVFRRTK